MRKVFKRYGLFCLTAATFFAVYSWVLDHIYYYIDYGDQFEYDHSIVEYGVYFLLAGFPLSIAIPVLYNFIVDKKINRMRGSGMLRFVFALLVGLSIGWIMGRHGVSFYIGGLRGQKNIILYPLISVSLEMWRGIKIYYRKKRRNFYGGRDEISERADDNTDE